LESPGGVPSKFDVIVVGAGPAGSSAGYLLAKAGFRVLMIERGRGAGSKELFGGKIYAAPLREVWPELDKEAPIHRWVGRERISLVKGDRITTIEYKLGRRVAFTTYLTEMAKWMAKKAVEAGAVLVDEVRVDEFVVEDGRVVGVRSGPDVVYADYVIDAEGVNRILLEKLGLAEKVNPDNVALGVKEVLNVGKKTIEEKLGLEEGEGLAWMVAGDVTRGIPGGGFIYTMKEHRTSTPHRQGPRSGQAGQTKGERPTTHREVQATPLLLQDLGRRRRHGVWRPHDYRGRALLHAQEALHARPPSSGRRRRPPTQHGLHG